MLTDIEELGIKIVVLLRKKLLSGFKCSDCGDDMRASRNHNGDADHSVPVFYHPLLDAQLYVCPIMLIPQSVYSFLDQYDYYEKYPSSAPTYEEVNPRFWEAVKCYENFMSLVESESQTPKKNPEDNLGKMRKLIKKGVTNG